MFKYYKIRIFLSSGFRKKKFVFFNGMHTKIRHSILFRNAVSSANVGVCFIRTNHANFNQKPIQQIFVLCYNGRMRFTSTRDKNLDSGFLNAILDALPSDGGLYVPEGNANLRRWILYMDERTPFSSIAGALTSACINDEFSPIICETIVTHAFPFEPKVKQLDENLFTMELFNGPTGCHRDFGISYLVSCLETISILQDRKPILLDITTGKHGAILSHVMREKKNIKSILVYPKGQLRGLSEKDFIWNGGNIFPVEADGDEELCRKLVREILSERSLVEKYTLTISTTANIGRLLPHSFFYTYAFSRLKKKVSGDIYYALAPGNYSNLVA